ncbi:MAG TPA: deaminase, partial [Solirubrobacterales bacterium]
MPDGFASDAQQRLMGLAIERAREAESHGDVPIGAVIARDGEPLAAAGNERELRRDPTAHAEILA